MYRTNNVHYQCFQLRTTSGQVDNRMIGNEATVLKIHTLQLMTTLRQVREALIGQMHTASELKVPIDDMSMNLHTLPVSITSATDNLVRVRQARDR